jgi:hypothetical protein
MSLRLITLSLGEAREVNDMARIDKLDALLFRVETAPLRALVHGREVDVPGSRAAVRPDTGHVLGVVGRDYQLVTHWQALELAFDCACKAFPATRRSEWRVAGVDAPAGGGSPPPRAMRATCRSGREALKHALTLFRWTPAGTVFSLQIKHLSA